MRKEQLIIQDNDTVISTFASYVCTDFEAERRKHTPAKYPEWSEDTKVLWEELKNRMKDTVSLDFDYSHCMYVLRETIKENSLLADKKDYMTSYYVGIEKGIAMAIKAIDDNMKKKQ